MTIKVFDRQKGDYFIEVVYGAGWLNWAYASKLGRFVVGRSLFQRLISKFMGFWKSTTLSKFQIKKFVTTYGINMDEFIVPNGGFKSFNDFFIREFKGGQRPFPKEEGILGAPAEGRLSVFSLSALETSLVIKGSALSLRELLGSDAMAREFVGGWAYVFRLCPVDYHRFHFPDLGVAKKPERIGGSLHSVNPIASIQYPQVFSKNERHVCKFQSKNFSAMALVEVGALCVGKIEQTYVSGVNVQRGAEKGYFSFGGSTTILFVQPGRIAVDGDLLYQSQAGFETFVRLGEPIARVLDTSGVRTA